MSTKETIESNKVLVQVTPKSSRVRISKKKPQGEKLQFDDENESVISNVDQTPIKKATDEVIKETTKLAPMKVLPCVKSVYKIVQKMTGSIGGNGYNGAIYGELTVGSMQKVLNILKDQCDLNHKSRFIDVGAGLGKPNFHASQEPAVRLSLGIELEHIRWQLSMHNLLEFAKHVEDGDLKGHVNFICNDIDNATTLDPFTHIYMYDLGFPPPLQQSIARKFNRSIHAQYLISYRPPRRVQEEYGFDVDYLTSSSTSMFGSGEGHTAYFYQKRVMVDGSRLLQEESDQEDEEEEAASTAKSTRSNKNNNPKKGKKQQPVVKEEAKQASTRQRKLLLPKREGYEEDDVEVYCDPIFYEASRLAGGLDVTALKDHVKQVVDDHLSGERMTRRSTRRAAAEE